MKDPDNNCPRGCSLRVAAKSALVRSFLRKAVRHRVTAPVNNPLHALNDTPNSPYRPLVCSFSARPVRLAFPSLHCWAACHSFHGLCAVQRQHLIRTLHIYEHYSAYLQHTVFHIARCTMKSSVAMAGALVAVLLGTCSARPLSECSLRSARFPRVNRTQYFDSQANSLQRRSALS